MTAVANKQSHLISVIIPVFNSIKFIDETLNSVLNQSHQNLEIIVVDDGSTDGSLDILKSIEDKRLRSVRNKGNGACAARNYGFQLSKGDYIQFLDADDLLSEHKIKKQLDLIKDADNCMAICSTCHFTDLPDNGTVTDRDFLNSTNKPKEFMLKLLGSDGANFEMVQTSAWLTPRKCIDKAGLWDESLQKDQDGEFFCRVAAHCAGILYEPSVLNYYRKHRGKNNISNKKERAHLESQLRSLESKSVQLKSESHTLAYQNAMALQYKNLAIEAYPEYGDISKKALDRSKDFGASDYLPVLGGRMVELIKLTFGWKAAKQLKKWVNSF